jgi:hypothetical protein
MRLSRYRPSAWNRHACLFLFFALPVLSQTFTQRGFFETRFLAYPQTAPGDSGRAVGEALLRYESAWKPWSGWRFAGEVDARADTHRQVERAWGLAWQDRDLRRPAFSVRRLSATYRRGPLTFEVGKQFIRWGKTDLLNPTDRFAPRDYLEVVDNDFLGVTAARLTLEKANDTWDLVWQPRFTPSRLPLLNQRWVVLPDIPIFDRGARYPGRSQFGARWNRLGPGFEYSLSIFDGFHHLPLLDPRVEINPVRVHLARLYPRLRMYGADAAVPLKWLTVKTETAWFTSPTRQADDYVLYVVQVERQAGEWFFIGGYAGEAVTTARRRFDFAPDRGLARAVLAHAGYTIDASRSLALEAAFRDSGDGVWTRFSYSHALGQHWRATASFSLIRGAAEDFFGQYRRNSHAALTLRYSF